MWLQQEEEAGGWGMAGEESLRRNLFRLTYIGRVTWSGRGECPSFSLLLFIPSCSSLLFLHPATLCSLLLLNARPTSSSVLLAAPSSCCSSLLLTAPLLSPSLLLTAPQCFLLLFLHQTPHFSSSLLLTVPPCSSFLLLLPAPKLSWPSWMVQFSFFLLTMKPKSSWFNPPRHFLGLSLRLVFKPSDDINPINEMRRWVSGS